MPILKKSNSLVLKQGKKRKSQEASPAHHQVIHTEEGKSVLIQAEEIQGQEKGRKNKAKVKEVIVATKGGKRIKKTGKNK